MHPHQAGMFSAAGGVGGECPSSVNDDSSVAASHGAADRPAPSVLSMGSRTSSVSGGDDDQQFCLRWHNFQTNLSMGFDSLLRNETFVDVTLACSTSYPGAPIPAIKCHKVVLAACSPYFEALLRGTPCQHPVIVLKDVRYEDLKPLVEFMYKGQVNVLQEQIPTLISLAEAFRIRGLAEVDQNNRVTLDPGDRSRASSVTENGDLLHSGGRNSAHSIVKEEYLGESSNFSRGSGGMGLGLGMKRSRMDDNFRPMGGSFGPRGFGSTMSCYPAGAAGQGSSSGGVGMIPLYQEPFDRGFGGPGGDPGRSQFYQRQGDGSNCSGGPGGSSSSHEIKPAIAEMILEEERARRMEAENYGHGEPRGALNWMPQNGNASNRFQPWGKMKQAGGPTPGGIWRKPWPPGGPSQYGNSNFRLRERGPVKTWTAETMAAALRAVLQNNLSLSRSARMFEIPYPTFVLYANKLHNLLGPSAGGDVRPKGRGRPQRILLGNWPNELVEGAIRSVVFREPPENFHHLSAQWNSNFVAQNANAQYPGGRAEGAAGNESTPASAGEPSSAGRVDAQSPKPDDGPASAIMSNPACDQSQQQSQQNPNLSSDQEPTGQRMLDTGLSPSGQSMMDVGQDGAGRSVTSPATAMPVMPNSQPSPGYPQMTLKMEQGHHSAVFPGMEHAPHYQQDSRVGAHHDGPVYIGHPMHAPQPPDPQVAVAAPPSEDMMASCLNL